MFAVFLTVKIDSANIDTARSMLAEQVVPTVKAQPGFVSGCWLSPVDGLGVSIVVFDSEANARAAAPPVGPMGPIVSVASVDIREVAALA